VNPGRAAVALLLGGCLVSACAVLRPRPSGPLVPVAARELPPFADDLDPASLRSAVEATLPVYERAGDTARAAAAARLLEIVAGVSDPNARRTAIAEAFRVVRVREPALLTAYFEPELVGRLVADETFRHALYARPPDLVDVDPRALDPACDCRRLVGRLDDGRLVPYLARAEIEAGALAGQGLELAWVADPFALFVLHVQGSGRLRLEDDTLLGVRYAGTNGRPYRSLARVLVESGRLPKERATLPDVRRYVETLSPDERTALLAANERYTFFRFAAGGPVGSLGVELTPGRSIASDPRLVPPGTLAYLATPTVRRFVVSQDGGAAIVGAHADLFLGAGAEAEALAGRMRERGDLYLVLPR
jgi:membrane-bound lytic murein transglycosylase A